MTAPVFVLPKFSQGNSSLAVGSLLTVDGPEGHHAADVQRVAVGQRVDVVDGHGTRAQCTVSTVAKGLVVVHIDAMCAEPEQRPRLILVQALAKGGPDELAIEMATELGVDEIIPWQADRSIARWKPERAAKSRASWVAAVAAAAKQSRRAAFPHVNDLVTSPALADLMADATAKGACALILHESATTRLSCIPIVSGCSEIFLAIGPEGGVSDDEIRRFTDAGATAVRLGPTVLRTSTAGAAALSCLSVALGRW